MDIGGYKKCLTPLHHSPPIQIFPSLPHSSRMEIHFQSHQEQEPEQEIPVQTTFRSRAARKNKYVGVRQRPSGKWVAEIKNTTQKIRMWLGTFDTPEEAARAYDEAACLLRGSNTRTNFVNHGSPPNSPLSLKIRNLFNRKRATKQGGSGGLSFKPTKKTIQTSGETCSNGAKLDAQIFDGAYKPELRNLSGGMEVGWSYQFDRALTEEVDGLPAMPSGVEGEIPEFERMKFERQISASLYAMNGVSEYWENFQDLSGDGFWDLLPVACQLFCSG